MKKISQKVRDLVKEGREKRGLTQKELANEIGGGLLQEHISHIENGHLVYVNENTKKVAEYMKISLGDLKEIKKVSTRGPRYKRISQTLRNAIIKARQDKELSQKDLAKKANTDYAQTVGHIENGTTKFLNETGKRICSILGIDVDSYNEGRKKQKTTGIRKRGTGANPKPSKPTDNFTDMIELHVKTQVLAELNKILNNVKEELSHEIEELRRKGD